MHRLLVGRHSVFHRFIRGQRTSSYIYFYPFSRGYFQPTFGCTVLSAMCLFTLSVSLAPTCIFTLHVMFIMSHICTVQQDYPGHILDDSSQGVLLYSCSTVQMLYCSQAVFCCTVAQLFRCSTVLKLFCCTVAQLCRCSTVPSCFAITVQLF